MEQLRALLKFGVPTAEEEAAIKAYMQVCEDTGLDADQLGSRAAYHTSSTGSC